MNDAGSAAQQLAHHGQLAVLYFGLLGAHLRAMAAQYAVVFQYLSVVILDVYCLHRTLAQATVAVLALHRPEFKIF